MKDTYVAMTISGVLSLGAGTSVYADTRDPGVDIRQAHQKDRIKDGLRSGELTGREAKHPHDEYRDAKRLERAYKSDGELTGRERRNLHRELDRAGNEIKKQKNNAQAR